MRRILCIVASVLLVFLVGCDQTQISMETADPETLIETAEATTEEEVVEEPTVEATRSEDFMRDYLYNMGAMTIDEDVWNSDEVVTQYNNVKDVYTRYGIDSIDLKYIMLNVDQEYYDDKDIENATDWDNYHKFESLMYYIEKSNYKKVTIDDIKNALWDSEIYCMTEEEANNLDAREAIVIYTNRMIDYYRNLDDYEE